MKSEPFNPIKFYESFQYYHDIGQVWRDSVHLMACTLQNSIKHPQWREKEDVYLSIARKYDKDTLIGFSKVLAYVIKEMVNNPRDVLGNLYMNLGLGDKKGMGQVFTPDEICDLMSMLTINEVENNTSINDPACGGGATLISGIKRIRQINPECVIIASGQDLDALCAQMCFIQLFCMGVEVEVYQCNTLTLKIYDQWLKPLNAPFMYNNLIREEN